jgi:hypothetical protein
MRGRGGERIGRRLGAELTCGAQLPATTRERRGKLGCGVNWAARAEREESWAGSLLCSRAGKRERDGEKGLGFLTLFLLKPFHNLKLPNIFQLFKIFSKFQTSFKTFKTSHKQHKPCTSKYDAQALVASKIIQNDI